MSSSASKVSRSVETVAGIAEENSAATEEVSATAQEMNAQAEQIVASSQSLKEMAIALQNSIAMFKVNEDAEEANDTNQAANIKKNVTTADCKNGGKSAGLNIR